MELKMSTSQQIIHSGIAQTLEHYLAGKRGHLTKLNESAEEWTRKACDCPKSKEDIIHALEALMVLTRWKGQVLRQCEAAEQLQQKLDAESAAKKPLVKGGAAA